MSARVKTAQTLFWPGTFIILLLCCSSIARAAEKEHFFLYPGVEDLEILEATTYALEETGNHDLIPFDGALRIKQNIGDDINSILEFSQQTGITRLLVGDFSRKGDAILFQGQLHLIPEGTRESVLASDTSPGLVCEQLSNTLSGHKTKGTQVFNDLFSKNDRANDLYSIGLSYLNTGEINKASSMFEAALDFDTGFLMARFRLAETYRIRGKIRLAEKMLLLEKDENIPMAADILRLSTMYTIANDKGRVTDAEITLRQALELLKKTGDSRRRIEMILTKSVLFFSDKKKYDEVQHQLDEAYRISTAINDQMGLARCALHRAQLGIKRRQKDTLPYVVQGMELAQKLRYDELIGSALYLQALSDRDEEGALSENALSLMSRAEVLFEKVNSVRKLLWIRIRKANYHLEKGEYGQMRKLTRQLREFAQSRGFFKADIHLGNMMATLSLREGKIATAVRILENNLFRLSDQEMPDLKRDVYTRLVTAYIQLESYKKAESISELILQGTKPGEDSRFLSTAYNNHGEILFLLGKMDDALTWYERSLAIKKRDHNPFSTAWTLRNIILIKTLQGDLHEAEDLLETCNALEPNKLETAVLTARLRYEQGRFDEAAILFEQLKERFPTRWNNVLDDIYQTFTSSRAVEKAMPLKNFLPNYL